MVEAEHAADAFASFHAPVVVGRGCERDNQLVGQALMTALDMIVLDEFGDEQSKMTLTKRHNVVVSHFFGEHPEAPFPAVELIKIGRAATSGTCPSLLSDGLESSDRRQTGGRKNNRPLAAANSGSEPSPLVMLLAP